MHLIDQQQHQLDSSLEAIEKLRAGYDETPSPGKVITSSPDEMAAALENCWLVVEASDTSSIPVHQILVSNGTIILT